ncbi:unnamed protein product, partial [Closterium sp. NIES-54]
AGGAAGAGAAGGAAGAGAARDAAGAGAAVGAANAGAAGGASGAVGSPAGVGAAGAAGPGGARTGGTGAAGAGGAAGVEAAGTGAGGVAELLLETLELGVLVLSLLFLEALRGRDRTAFCSFSRFLLQPASPLPGPSPFSGPTRGLTEHREPKSRPVLLESRPASPESRSELPVCTVCAGRLVSRPRPPPLPGTHSMTLRPSTAPQRVPLPSPPASSLPDGLDPESNSLRAASPTVTCFLATAVSDPLFESTAASALVAELVDFAAACRLDYAASLVAESTSASVCPPSVRGECALGTDVLEDRQEEFECFAAAVPHLVSMLLAPEGDLDAPDIPTPRSYAKAIEGPYSSQWQAAMDAEMASWKSTGTYVDEVPPPGANIISGMWIFRVKQPPGSPPVFKARYIARGFSQRQGVDFFHTFSPTPKMTTLRIWLRRPPGFTGSFPAGTQWSLRRQVYGLRQAPCEWHNTLRTTLAALGFTPSTSDPSLFLLTDTTLPPFYVLVYVDDLVFATADTEALAHVKSELQKRHTCTDLGELTSYLGLRITRDRAQRTITLTQSHMVPQVLQRFGFTYSSPQSTPLPTGHSLSAPPSDESVEPSGLYPELVGCLMYLMTCTRPDLAYPLSLLARYVAPSRHRKVHWDAAKRVLRYLCSTSGMGLVLGGRARVVLTGHAGASWVDDLAMQRSSHGYTFSLGSCSVSWRSTRSSFVLSSSCEAEIYAGAMAAQELRWLNYLPTDLGEAPRSPLVLYVNNKAMLALCQEHRLEHRRKHIALRYFLARELQQRGQLRLAYVASQANTADVFTKALQPCRRDLITWRESIEPQLEVAGLKGFADGTVPIPLVDDVGLRGEFCAAHLLTFMVISRCCSPVVQLALRSCREQLDAGHQAWHFILSTYQVRDNLYIAQLEEKMTHIRMGEQESATDYCNHARRILAEMRMAGAEYSMASYISYIVKGLPRGYNLMKRMMMVPEMRESLDEDSITSYILQDEEMQEAEQPRELFPQVNYAAPTKLNQQQGQRRKPSGGGRSTVDVNEKRSARDKGRGGGGRRRECWICHDPDHLSYECPDRDDSDEDNTKGGRGRSTSRWRELLGGGDSYASQPNGGATRQRLLPPSDGDEGGIRRHGAKRRREARAWIQRDVARLCDRGGARSSTLRRTSPLHRPSPLLDVVAVDRGSGCADDRLGDELDPCRLHARLAYVSVDTIKSSAKHKVATGLNITPTSGADPPCVLCVGGKLTRHTFPAKGSDAEEALAVVRIDFCRPFWVAAKDGSLYFLLLKDRHTRFVWVMPVAKKSDVLQEFHKWLVLVERQVKKSVLMLRSDWGGEFLGKEFTDFVDAKGIVHDLTCPYTPQQTAWLSGRCARPSSEEVGADAPLRLGRGVPREGIHRLRRRQGHRPRPDVPLHSATNGMAKREMRTAVESVRTMLLHMGVQHHWWHLALRQAVWVRNCLERSTTPPGTTPYQLLIGKKPDLTLARVWVCMVHFRVPEQQRSGKLAPKARWGFTWACRRRVDDGLLYDDTEEDDELPELDPDMHADPEHRWDIVTMTVKEALASWKGKAVKAAMEEEIRSLVGMGTWELVKRPRGVNIMKNRWVLTTKYRLDDTVEREKARLVVKGFTQLCGADHNETYSPPLRGEAIAAAVVQGTRRCAAGRWLEEEPGRRGALLQGQRQRSDLLGAGLRRRPARRQQQPHNVEGALAAVGGCLRAARNFAGRQVPWARVCVRQASKEAVASPAGLRQQAAQALHRQGAGRSSPEDTGLGRCLRRAEIRRRGGAGARGGGVPAEGWLTAVRGDDDEAGHRVRLQQAGERPHGEERPALARGRPLPRLRGRRRRGRQAEADEQERLRVRLRRGRHLLVELAHQVAEYVAATNAGKEGRRLRFLLAEFKLLDVGKPTILRVDNKSAITVAAGLGLTGNLKHMKRRYAWLQHMVRRGKFVLKYIPTIEQPADFLTKALHFPAFNRCSVAIGQVRLDDVSDGDDDVQQ